MYGNIIIVGEFTTYNGQNAVRIARIDTNGKLDHSFNVGLGPNMNINSIDLLSNGKLVIGGDFNKFNLVDNNGIILLNSDGSVYENFSIVRCSGF